MKKCEKGAQGYLDYKKRAEILRTVVYFLISVAIFLLGYSQTHTKQNVLTVVAVVGCLPGCKALTGVITRLPYKSVGREFAQEIQEKCPHLTVVFDLVITSTEKIMPIDVIVISGDKIFGYTSSQKVDLEYAAKHIKSMLIQNQFDGVSVKLQNQYKPFIARAEGLNNIAAVEKDDTAEQEEQIAGILKQISL